MPVSASGTKDLKSNAETRAKTATTSSTTSRDRQDGSGESGASRGNGASQGSKTSDKTPNSVGQSGSDAGRGGHPVKEGTVDRALTGRVAVHTWGLDGALRRFWVLAGEAAVKIAAATQ